MFYRQLRLKLFHVALVEERASVYLWQPLLKQASQTKAMHSTVHYMVKLGTDILRNSLTHTKQ